MSVVLRMISEDCSAVAFYGIKSSAKAAEACYHTCVKWFTDVGHPPDKLGVKGTGHSGNVGSFSRGNRKLQKMGFHNVIAFELISTTPDAGVRGRDYLLTATYQADGQKFHAHLVGRSSLAKLSVKSMLPVARTLAQELQSDYGIGYTRKYDLGPEWYAMGVCKGLGFSDEDDEEAMNITDWGCVGMVKHVYRQGLLRDVYSWNFLTQPQLTRPIGNVSLEEWIRQNTHRGALSLLCDGISLWEVTDANIPDIRQALRQAGAIFDWRTYPD